MAIFTTFKASILTNPGGHLNKGDVFFFHPDNPYTTENIVHNLKGIVFEFSQEDIMFSEQQKIKYGKFLLLHPIQGVGDTFSDGVKYTLLRQHVKGKTEYSIEVDNQKADLILDWYNKQKIEWVHGKKVNWTTWQVAAAFTAAAFVGIVGYFNYNKPTILEPSTDTLKTGNKNQLPLNDIDTTKKNDSLKTWGYTDTTKK
jgi:hypothetical protein